MVAVHPTRGLDVGATESVQRILLKQRDEGLAILLISEDLDELLALSDRIAVMNSGRITGMVDAEEADIAEIGLMMACEQPAYLSFVPLEMASCRLSAGNVAWGSLCFLP